jgi:hypothetical protein
MILHTSAAIRGLLALKDLSGVITDDQGRELSDAEAREYLHDCLEKGWKVLPMSGKCDNFDYQTGCKGHPSEGESP